MPKRKKPELAPNEQRKLFEVAAKKADVTDDDTEFEKAFKIVAKNQGKSKKAG